MDSFLESDVDDVIEDAEIAADFGRGLAHYGDVLADELADHVDERADGTSGTDDARYPTRGAAVTDRVKQLSLTSFTPWPAPMGPT